MERTFLYLSSNTVNQYYLFIDSVAVVSGEPIIILSLNRNFLFPGNGFMLYSVRFMLYFVLYCKNSSSAVTPCEVLITTYRLRLNSNAFS